MKFLSDQMQKAKKHLSEMDNREVHLVATAFGYQVIDPPKMAKDLICQFCGTDQFFLSLETNGKRAWLCGLYCEASRLPKDYQWDKVNPPPKQTILWPEFCEINGIGDIHHVVKFEKIEQSPGKIEFLRNFCKKPSGIIFMRGDTGTGKTYAAMGACEMFIRSSKSCYFSTQKQIHNCWIRTFKSEIYDDYIDRITRVSLLVIDDFGTADPSKAFMEFFMDLINSRMQWTDRGTIITTNLDNDKFTEYCGDALADRIQTGQLFYFQNKSRRTKKIL